MSFILLPLYTRFLTVSDFGILSIVNAIGSFLRPIYKMGLVGAVMRFFFDMDDETERKEYNGTIWIFLIITTFLTTLLISLFGKPVFEGIFENISFHPYINVVIWTLFFVPTFLKYPQTNWE